jgi:hypothetical protein
MSSRLETPPTVVVRSGIAEKEALKNGMEEKSREFTKKGSEIYAKA